MCFKFTPHDFATDDLRTQDDKRPPAELRFVTPDCPQRARACAARRGAWVEPARPAAPLTPRPRAPQP